MCACAQLASHVQLCDQMDRSPPGSSVHGISQAKVLEWAAVSSSRTFPDPGKELCLLSLLHWQVDSLPLAPCGDPPPHILDINPLLGILLTNIFSHSTGRLFILLIAFFAMKNSFKFDGEFRQAKTKRIYHCKTSFTRNVKRTTISRAVKAINTEIWKFPKEKSHV